jgi:hypothetical protein
MGSVDRGIVIVAILVAAAQTRPRNLAQIVMLSPQRSRALGGVIG